MSNPRIRYQRRARRQRGIRKMVTGTPHRPRLAVHRTLKHMYAQIIDDLSGQTLVSASTLQAKVDPPSNTEAAKKVGAALAEAAKAKGISAVAFDRRGFKYHGRVKAVADGAREAGLQF